MLKTNKQNFDKCAILFRGYHFLNDRHDCFCDGRIYFKSVANKIIHPLKKKYKHIDIYLATFPSPILGDVLDFYRPKKYYVDHKGILHNQRLTMLHGLNLFDQEYDRYFIFRFDLEYKKSILEWNIWQNTGIYLPWREYRFLWNDHRRVADTIHITDYLEKFRYAIKTDDGSSGGFHHIHKFIDKSLQRFICNGFFDSNSSTQWAEGCNPLYYIKHRPYYFSDLVKPKILL